MTKQHTPGPWSQGYTLATRQTRRWSPEEIAANDAHERLMVFSGFTHLDEGRGRERVALCYRAEDACLIAAAPELLQEVEWLLDAYIDAIRAYAVSFKRQPNPEDDRDVIRIRALIAKVRGTQ